MCADSRLCRGFRLAPGRSWLVSGSGPSQLRATPAADERRPPGSLGAAVATADRARLRARLVLADGRVFAALEKLRAVLLQ